MVWRGWPATVALFDRAGARVGWLAAFYLLPLALATGSWRMLLRPGARLGPGAATYASWVGLAVNWLLPVAQVGGEVVKVWLIGRRGVANEDAFASVVVDKTLQVATQVGFTLIGLGLFAAQYTQNDLVVGILAGAVLLSIGTIVFYRVQRRGMFAMVAKVVERFISAGRAEQVRADAHAVDQQVLATYGRSGRLAVAFALRMAFRLVMVGEVMLAAWMLEVDITLGEALIIESLVQAVRAGAFVIPGGLGAQDGALVALGLTLGLAVPDALAIALAKRVRELAVGLPALAAWQCEQLRAARRDQPPPRRL